MKPLLACCRARRDSLILYDISCCYLTAIGSGAPNSLCSCLPGLRRLRQAHTISGARGVNYFPHLSKAKPVSVTQVCVCAFLNCALSESLWECATMLLLL